jgi:hypothetical protein
MIVADARSRLTPNDLQLLSRALGGDGSDCDRALIELGIDSILDRPELPRYLLDGRMPGPSASLFFYVLVRHALRDEGFDDRSLADYLAALLREFGVKSRANQVDRIDDHEHHYLVDILTDLAHTSGHRHFKVSLHLGNYALWLTGLFPDRIRARLQRGGPSLGYYESLGQRGFAEASEHEQAEWVGLHEILETTAEHFTGVRRALNRVRSDLKLAA